MTVQAPTNEDLLVREIRQMPREYWPNLLQLIRLFRESVTLKPADSLPDTGRYPNTSSKRRYGRWHGLQARDAYGESALLMICSLICRTKARFG